VKIFAAPAHDRYWHISDMADALANVCYRGEDRTWDTPAAMSQFDPRNASRIANPYLS